MRGLAPLRSEGTRRRGGKGRCLLPCPFLCSLPVPRPVDQSAVDMPDVPVAAVPVSAVWCLAVAPLACDRHLRARWWLDDGRWQVVSGHPTIRILPKPLTAGLGECILGWMPVDKDGPDRGTSPDGGARLLGKKAQLPSSLPPQSVKSHKEDEVWAQSCCCAPQPKALDGASASRNILERCCCSGPHDESSCKS